MSKILNAVKWFLDGFTFKPGYCVDWDFFALAVSYNRPYWHNDEHFTRRLSIHIGPAELYLEGKEDV